VAKTEETIISHIRFLEEHGMCVNETKTEVMWIGSEIRASSININNKDIPLVNNFKALGITLSNNLSWENHAQNTISKGRKMLGSMKYIRKYLNEEQFLKSVANNFFSTIFYANSVWFDSLKKSTKAKFDSMYYRMLRIATKDYKRVMHKKELITRCKRATPSEWAQYSTSSKVIKIIRDKCPPIINERLRSSLYVESRRPGLGFFFDNSKSKRGKQSIQNRLPFFKNLMAQWMDNGINDDAIRTMLKKSFFSYCTEE